MSKSNKSNGSQDDNGDYVIDRDVSLPASFSTRSVKNSHISMYDPRENRIIKESAFTRWIGTFARQHFLFHRAIHFPPTCLVHPPLSRFFWELYHRQLYLSHFPTLQELNLTALQVRLIYFGGGRHSGLTVNNFGRIFHGCIIVTDFRSCIVSYPQ